MKLNRKLFISSLGLLGLSAVAMSTATYAWFTVDKTASMTATATIKAEAGVEIGNLASGGHTAHDYTSSGTIELGAHELTDISGNGVSFFKPVFASDNIAFSAVDTIGYSSDAKLGWAGNYITVALTFRSNKPYHVLVGQSTDIIEGALAPAARIALFDGGKVSTANTTPTLANLKQVLYSGDAPEYFISADTAESTVTHTGTGDDLEVATGYSTWDAVQDDSETTTLVHSDVVDSKYGTLALAKTAGLNSLTVLQDEGGTYTVGTGATAKTFPNFTGTVIATIWVDGVDPECVNSIINGSLTVTLPFQFLLEADSGD